MIISLEENLERCAGQCLLQLMEWSTQIALSSRSRCWLWTSLKQSTCASPYQVFSLKCFCPVLLQYDRPSIIILIHNFLLWLTDNNCSGLGRQQERWLQAVHQSLWPWQIHRCFGCRTPLQIRSKLGRASCSGTTWEASVPRRQADCH